MKKVLTIEQVRQADAYTIENEPIVSIDLMERAADGCYNWIEANVLPGREVKIFCGMGNNGGDGLVIARKLAEAGNKVVVLTVQHSQHPTPDYSINLQRLTDQHLVKIIQLTNIEDFPETTGDELIIDALLGSGLTKAVSGLMAEVIEKINKTSCFKLAIDVPSGLFCDRPSELKKDIILKANHTLTFEVPKMAYFFPENEPFTGHWTLLPIGLHPGFLEQLMTQTYLIEKQDIAAYLRPRSRFAHKGNFGHGLLIAGSYGKMGAAVLGARSALRTGAGLVTAHIPGKGHTILQTAVPEAMCSIDPAESTFTSPPDLAPYKAIAVGPGIGVEVQTANALKLLIQNAQIPLILDADALNLLAENKTWLSFLPPFSILTPHLKEFERLTGKAADSFERNQVQREFSRKYGVYIVLKGAFSCISFPDGKCFFNPTGNPGMASGGSGDVLTGIILGFLSQGYTPGESALLGVFFHGLAGDLAASTLSEEALIAGDIVDFLPHAFQIIHKK